MNKPPRPACPSVAPAIEVTTIDGRKITSADFAGKVVLLDFWATWCAPCLEEMPHLLAVWEKYGRRDDFVMIGLSRDFDVGTLKNFLRVNDGITWPNAVGVQGGVETAALKFGVTWIPRVYLIDRKGKVVGKNLRGAEVAEEGTASRTRSRSRSMGSRARRPCSPIPPPSGSTRSMP